MKNAILTMILSLASIQLYANTDSTKICTARSSDGSSEQTVILKFDKDNNHVRISESYKYAGDNYPESKTEGTFSIMELAGDVQEGLTPETKVRHLNSADSEIVQAMFMESNAYYDGQKSGLSLKDVRSGTLFIFQTLSNVPVGTYFKAFDKNGNLMGSFYRSGTFLAACK